MSELGESASLPERARSAWDALRSSFGFLSGVAMALGLLVGFVLPSVDAALDVNLPVFGFAEPDIGRSLLQTVATATVSVASVRDGSATPVLAEGEGYVSSLQATRLLTVAGACDGLVVQRAQIGEYVTPGLPLADVVCSDDRRETLASAVRAAFVLGRQRTPVQDAAFPLRQLADVALKGLSPGINDPTTAQNAIEALTSLLIRSATGKHPSRLRADEHDVVRFVALAPDLDDLVRLGFEQVRVFAAPHPALSRRLLTLLAHIDDAAQTVGVPCTEPGRQAALIAEGPDSAVPTTADAGSVRAQHAGLWTRSGERPPGGASG